MFINPSVPVSPDTYLRTPVTIWGCLLFSPVPNAVAWFTDNLLPGRRQFEECCRVPARLTYRE